MKAKLFESKHENQSTEFGVVGVGWDEYEFLIGILMDDLGCELIEYFEGWSFEYTLKTHGIEFKVYWDEMTGVWAYAIKNQISDINNMLRVVLEKAVEIFNSRKYFPD